MIIDLLCPSILLTLEHRHGHLESIYLYLLLFPKVRGPIQKSMQISGLRSRWNIKRTLFLSPFLAVYYYYLAGIASENLRAGTDQWEIGTGHLRLDRFMNVTRCVSLDRHTVSCAGAPRVGAIANPSTSKMDMTLAIALKHQFFFFGIGPLQRPLLSHHVISAGFIQFYFFPPESYSS